MSFILPSTLIFALLDRTIAVALGVSAATVALLLKGGYYAGRRVIYGKELTTDEKVLQELQRLNHIAEALEKRERSLENREIKLEKAIGELIRHDYCGNTHKNNERNGDNRECDESTDAEK